MQQRLPSSKQHAPRLLHLLREDVQHVDLVAVDGVADAVLQLRRRPLAHDAVRLAFVLAHLFAVVAVQSGEAHASFRVEPSTVLQQQLDAF